MCRTPYMKHLDFECSTSMIPAKVQPLPLHLQSRSNSISTTSLSTTQEEDFCNSCEQLKASNNNRRRDLPCNPEQTFFSLGEIQQNNNIDSAWLIAGNKVYDVTEYIELHPGGRQSILKYAGGVKDVTRDLQFHSKAGQRAWKKYHIGYVKSCCTEKQHSSSWWQNVIWWWNNHTSIQVMPRL